jgi:hypothetical protein
VLKAAFPQPEPVHIQEYMEGYIHREAVERPMVFMAMLQEAQQITAVTFTEAVEGALG